MKKRILLALVLLFSLFLSLVSCAQDEPNPSNSDSLTDSVKIRIGYFAGTTGIGMAKMISDADSKYTFTQYDGPTTIIPAIVKGDVDIAALPTNAAPNVYTQSNQGVQMLAINTLGVLYVCTNGTSVSSLSDLAGKTIYVPEQAPKLVLQYILARAGVEAEISMEYNLDTLPNAIAQGIVNIAVLPEPKLTVAENLYKKAAQGTDVSSQNNNANGFSVALSLTDEWDKVSTSKLVQGCLIVSKSFASSHAAELESFLSDYQASIAYMKDPNNIESAATIVVNAGILPNVAVAKQAIPRSNITYMIGADMKAAAQSFYTALSLTNPADDFYFFPAAAQN